MAKLFLVLAAYLLGGFLVQAYPGAEPIRAYFGPELEQLEPQPEAFVSTELAFRAVSLDQFRQEALELHNKFRAKHQVAALSIDDKLNTYAQEWADYLAANSLFQHRTEGKYGENLFYGTGNSWTATDAVTMWYNEVNNYDFATHEKKNPRKMIGHFTQVVWKGSKKIGIGMAFNDKSNNMYIVANYDPPGNYIGQYPENVLPAA